MGAAESSYYQGIPLTTENRNFWSPWATENFQVTRNNENRQFWSPLSASWSPWPITTYQENKKNENCQNSQLFVHSKDFSSAAGGLSEMQSQSGGFVNDQSMIFQNIINENLLKNSQNFHPSKDFTSRKRNRRKRRRNAPEPLMPRIANNATKSSSHRLQQHGYQDWNHVPVLNWSKSNLPPRSTKNAFQNTALRSRSSNKCDEKSHQYQIPASNTIASVVVSKATVSRGNYKSQNFPNNYGGTLKMGNTASNSLPTSNCRSRLNVKENKLNEGKKTQMESSTSTNFENNKEDIIYLFSVDSASESKMILEIDLESDGAHVIPNRISKGTNSLSQKSKPNRSAEGKQPVIVGESVSKVPENSRKRKLHNDDTASKRSNYVPRCTECRRCYDDVVGKSGNMYISSSCTHIFCGFCISKRGKTDNCSACNVKVHSFRRLYL